jgi:hypothetical protein
MNVPELKVTFRTTTNLITARLEFDGTRPFAVICEYGPKGSPEVIKSERMELDPAFLEKIDPKLGADYLYKKEVTLPEPRNN